LPNTADNHQATSQLPGTFQARQCGMERHCHDAARRRTRRTTRQVHTQVRHRSDLIANGR
jgi:hypothetical protein